MQSKTESLIETCINIFSGFIISLAVWQWVAAPLYGFQVSMQDNLGITGIFTVSAIIRGYWWRRFFSNQIHKKIHKLFDKSPSTPV